MSEKLFVSQSAPTLAGIKTGNLFTAEFADSKIATKEIFQVCTADYCKKIDSGISLDELAVAL